jgi:hypothetical protein
MCNKSSLALPRKKLPIVRNAYFEGKTDSFRGKKSKNSLKEQLWLPEKQKVLKWFLFCV